MRRTYVRRRAVVPTCVMALLASLVVIPGQVAQAAPTPGQQAKRLQDDLRKLENAESALRTQAQSARTALTVGTARWNAAKKKLTAARKNATEKSAQAAKATEQAEKKRGGVAAFAAGTYQNPLDSSVGLAAGLTSDPTGQARNMADLEQVGQQQASSLDAYKAAKLAADVFAKQAKRAEKKATTVEVSLRKQTVSLRLKAKSSTAALSKAMGKVNALESKITALEAKERKRLAKIAAKKRAALAKALAKRGLGGGFAGTPGCRKSSRLNYPNGLIPQSALCPLPQAGWYLRADAAKRFYRLNAAYRARFGSNICVNSAYRPLRRQYQLYASMPSGYAAVPGTSNHGEGVAVDLGCGINSFGSVQHNWMDNHAGRFGWMQPAWAHTGPIEPWHWEYHG